MRIAVTFFTTAIVAGVQLPVQAHAPIRALEASHLHSYVARSLTNEENVDSSVSSRSIENNIVGNSTGASVTQVHLALGSTPSTMSVSWTCAEASQVVYGISPTTLDHGPVKPFSSKNYSMQTVPRSTDVWQNYTSGVINHAQLEDLTPATTYYYQIIPSPNASGTPAVPSSVMSFSLPPSAGDPSPMIFDVVGDLGQTNYSNVTVSHIALDANNGSHFVLHVGDMAYADCDEPRWDSYFDSIQPLASHLPWMVSAGNHEIEPNNLTGRIMDPYKARYNMPAEQATVDTTQYYQEISKHGFDCTPSAFTGSYDYGNSFYSFQAGLVHFIVLNSYTHTDNASNQYKWLKTELDHNVDRQITPWVIAMWHSPWYNSNKDHHDEFNTVAMRSNMESLLVDASVALIFSGHVHAYERTYPVAFNKTTKDAPTYIIIGDGGNREGHAEQYASWQNWSAFRNASDFGHGRVQVLNKTHLKWEWHINDENEWIVSDSVLLVNPVQPAPPAPPPFPNSTCNATSLVQSHVGPPAKCAWFNNGTGHKTIGYGFDMEVPAARRIFTSLGLNYDKIFFGNTCINQTTINALLQIDLYLATFQVVSALGSKYTSYCCNVANALVDIVFNRSSTLSLKHFNNVTSYILARNWTGASRAINASGWCSKEKSTCASDSATIAEGCPSL
jgi:hypothetical protein